MYFSAVDEECVFQLPTTWDPTGHTCAGRYRIATWELTDNIEECQANCEAIASCTNFFRNEDNGFCAAYKSCELRIPKHTGETWEISKVICKQPGKYLND